MITPTATQPLDQPSNATLVLIHVAFVLAGVMTTLLGPMLPLLAMQWSLNDTQAGSLFTAQFTGSMLGVALSGLLVQARGYRVTLVSGLGAIAAGVAALVHASWTPGVAAVFLYGVGLGFVMPTGNLLIAEWNPRRRAAALNWLNLAWGIGAAGCPFAVKTLASSHRIYVLLLGIVAVSLLLALVAIFPSLAFPDVPPPQRAPGEISSIGRSRFAFLLGALFFLYVGTENGIGGWVASYAQRMQNGAGTFWVPAPSLFWISLLAGRAIAAKLLRYVGELQLASVGLMIASCGVTVLLAAHTIGILLAGVALSGLGLASIFPINISLLSLRFGRMAPRIGGAMFALAGLGGATLPWLVGSISTRFGGLKTGLWVPWIGCLVMLVLYFFVRHSPRRNAGSDAGDGIAS